MNSVAPEFRVISSLAGVEELADDWRELWHADPMATIFQCFEWVFTWLDVYSSYVDEIFIVACYSEGALVGLCPFYLRYRNGPGFRQKQLLFVGTGEPERVEVAAEYMNLLSVAGHRRFCLEQVGLALDSRTDIGAVMLFDLVETRTQPLLAVLTDRFPRCSLNPVGFNFAVPVSAERLPKTFSVALRKSAGNKLNRLMRLGGFRLISAHDSATSQRLFRAMAELHNRRWQKRGEPGAFAEELFRDFHRRVIELLLPLEAVILFGLEINGTIIAVHYCLVSPNRCHYYQGGIDEDFRPNVSPGLMCHVIAHQECRKRGIASYDLMKGSGDDYKAGLARPQDKLLRYSGFRNCSELLKHATTTLARRAVDARECA